MNESYERFLEGNLCVNNPNLDEDKPICEQLISCVCSAQYIVWVNGNTPISDEIMTDIFCPNCGQPASNFVSVSGHSGDYFNVTAIKFQR